MSLTLIWRSIGREFAAVTYVSHTFSLHFLHLNVKHHFSLQNIQSTRFGHIFLKLVYTNYFIISFKYLVFGIYNFIIIIFQNSFSSEIRAFYSYQSLLQKWAAATKKLPRALKEVTLFVLIEKFISCFFSQFDLLIYLFVFFNE